MHPNDHCCIIYNSQDTEVRAHQLMKVVHTHTRTHARAQP